MNHIWILLVFLPIISAQVKDPRTVQYTCYGGGKVGFQVNTTSNDTIYDIFSTDPNNSCSLSNKDFSGNGTVDSPYEIMIDVHGKSCGAKIVNQSFIVEFAIKSHEHFFSTELDHIYSMECTLENPQVTVFHTRKVSSYLLTYKMEMKVVSANSMDISDGQVKLGQKIKLKLEILKNHNVKRGRVTLCYTKDTRQIKPTEFYNNKCPTKSYPVTNLRFATNKTNPSLIESTEFKAFQFHEQGEVKFTCYVELCSEKKDPYCLNTGCVRGTFLHSYTKVETTIKVISAANQMSFSLMPVTAFMIFLTKFNWV